MEQVAELQVLSATAVIQSTPAPIATAVITEPQTFEQFVSEVSNGESNLVRGVYVDGVLALRVVQQPKGDQLFVSTNWGEATQFQTAARNGVTGLLATIIFPELPISSSNWVSKCAWFMAMDGSLATR